MKRGDFRSRIDPKPSLDGKSGKENLERETRAGLLEKEGKTRIFFSFNFFKRVVF